MASVSRQGSGPTAATLKKVVISEAAKAMDRSLKVVEGAWRSQLVPGEGGYRTGTYSRSITTNVTVSENRVTGEVGTALRYAPWLEYGTGIYGPRHQVIRPKTARSLGADGRYHGGVLAFPQPGNSGFTLAGRQRSGRAGAMAKWVYAKYVKGIKPRLYAQKAAERSRPQVIAEFKAAGARIVQRLEAGGS